MKRSPLLGLALACVLAGPEVRAADEDPAKGADAKKQADELVATAKGCIDKARMLVGDERKEAQQKQYAAAVEAYGKALERYPDWQLDSATTEDHWARFAALQKRGDLWKAMNQYDKAREEYTRGFEKVPPAMVDLRSYIQMTIADSYFEKKNWIAAEEAYLQAERIGLYGDRKVLVPEQLEKVKPLAEQQRKEMAGKAAQKP
jgi:tetratricopeptide (TPR) repeat protein